MEGRIAINKGKRKRIGSGTSVTVKFSPLTIMIAVWIRSKPDPVTSMLRPPLKRKYTHIRTSNKTVKHVSPDLLSHTKTSSQGKLQEGRLSSSTAPGVIFTGDENKLV